MNSDISKLTEALPGLYELFDLMDKQGIGTEKYIPGHSTTEIFKLNLTTFLLYVAEADAVIEESEAELINEVLDQSLSAKDYEELARQSGINGDTFAEEIPLIFRTLSEVCNKMTLASSLLTDTGEEDADKEDSAAGRDEEDSENPDTEREESSEKDIKENQMPAILTYQFFCACGLAVMVSDRHLKQSEYDRICSYMQMTYDFLNSSMVRGLSSPPPQQLFQTIMKPQDGAPGLEDLEQDAQPSAGNDPDREKSLDELLDEMNSLIGLDEVKTDLLSLINLVRIKSIREAKGLPMPPISLHLVFSGNPGTGKTTVARLLAKIYKKLGILSQGQLVETDRSGLIAGYVGQTAIKVQDVIQSALGGVLFIDEAYSLTPENASNDYGAEAIDTLVKSMEDHRDDLIVIAAGYTEPMKRFIAANPGLKSRFNKFITFRDYTPDELMKIFDRFCRTSGYKPTIPALLFVRDYFTQRLKDGAENFANAREARNLFEFAIARQASRLITESDLSRETLALLTADDVSGKANRTGHNELLTESIIASLNTKKRQGIAEKYLPATVEEMEFSPRCRNALTQAGIRTINDILDYLDKGGKLTEIKNISTSNESEVLQGLKLLGWTGGSD